MDTHELISRRTGIAGALLVGLLSQPAMASEEFVVYGAAKTVAYERQVFRSDVEQYIRAFNQELRSTLDQDLKRQLAPKVELASRAGPTRG